MLYVPALRKTVWPAGQAVIAALTAAAVTPGDNVVQIVGRGGIGAPAILQSTARLGLRTPDQDCACKLAVTLKMVKVQKIIDVLLMLKLLLMQTPFMLTQTLPMNPNS
jgi:hypothetical protein